MSMYSQTRYCENCGAEITMEDPRIGWVTDAGPDDAIAADECPETYIAPYLHTPA